MLPAPVTAHGATTPSYLECKCALSLANVVKYLDSFLQCNT